MSTKPCPLEVFEQHGMKLLKAIPTEGVGNERWDGFNEVRAKLCGPYGRVYEHEWPKPPRFPD